MTLNTLRDLLLLAGRKVTLKSLRDWSLIEREAAADWASAIHLRASDNPVRVPRTPKHVASLPESP